MHQSISKGLCASAAVAALLTGAAHAQEADGPVDLRGITVEAKGLGLDTPATGSRLNLTPLETPASIEVLSGEDIRSRGDRVLLDAVTRATGITADSSPGNGGTAVASRGFRGQGSVMWLRDGLRLYVGAGTITFPFDPWTVERVEVLRGPSSVMYGEGSIGGAINVVSRQAAWTPTFEAQVGVGSFSTYRAAAGGGGPIGDRAAFRLDAAYEESDGFVDRGDSKSLAIAGSLELRVSDDFTLTLTHDYGDQRPQQYFGAPRINGQLDERNIERNFNVADARIRYGDNWSQARAVWAPSDNLTFRNVLYRFRSDRNWLNVEAYAHQPATGLVRRTDYIGIGHDQKQWGDRADVTWRYDNGGGISNELVAGVEVNRIRFVHSSNTPFAGSSDVDPFNPAPGLFIVTADFINRYRTLTDQYAYFLEDRLELSPQIALVGGLRFDSADFERRDLLTGARFGRVFENLTGRIGVVWTPSDTLSVYGQYGTGTDPLGSLITSSQQQTLFDNATAKQYEIGIKQIVLGGRGQWTLAAYDITKDNLLSRDPVNSAVVLQIGSQSSRGVEAAASLDLGGGWSVDANAALLRAQFEDFDDLVGGALVSRSGKTPPGVPEKTANLWLKWQATEAINAQAGVRYVGRRFLDNANTATIPSYTVVDVGVGWQFTDRLEARVDVRNLLDETYVVSGNVNQWRVGAPRNVELRLTARY